MLLSEIFDYLNYGELSQIKLGDNRETGIAATAYPAVVTHLNMALIELYKRFPIRQREIQIQTYTSITEYELKTKFSATNGTEPIKYLLDSATDPFLARVLKVERVTTSDVDVTDDLPLNDVSNDKSILLLGYNILKVPEPNGSDILTVHYRAAPDKVVSAGLDPSIVEIPLPDSLMEPLIFYIAARAHANITSIDGNPSEGILYMQKFEASVLKAKEIGAIDLMHESNNRPCNNGWV